MCLLCFPTCQLWFANWPSQCGDSRSFTRAARRFLSFRLGSATVTLFTTVVNKKVEHARIGGNEPRKRFTQLNYFVISMFFERIILANSLERTWSMPTTETTGR